jgi:hypothetical protein
MKRLEHNSQGATKHGFFGHVFRSTSMNFVDDITSPTMVDTEQQKMATPLQLIPYLLPTLLPSKQNRIKKHLFT